MSVMFEGVGKFWMASKSLKLGRTVVFEISNPANSTVSSAKTEFFRIECHPILATQI